ncbi:homoserine kinase [Desulfitobacterium dichloroeliminans LMG P-21439]|uniref:Homoserine kinase n=1 Tax=Desulfitobacterium dichloroeliminans (strain LMG P-21439 / DCA1) TaxID=871963 RepID=L0F8Y3_DESDL|nr:homoserine kinase [Desulfitobacterium dichloroeliminans]AGA69101.1 homoserine kinase [Desulfitobacterium dichloroeliminans LMG P-21439]
MVFVRIPATSANLGPGFDCLGMALSLYNFVQINNSDSFQITLTGDYSAGIATDDTNLVWRSMCTLWTEIGFKIPTVSLILENNVPPTRGLGSSSAAIVGGLVAANEYAGDVLSKQEILQLANRIEGHPDNVAPALLGGITLAVSTETSVIARVLQANPLFTALAIVPDFHLSTEKSRKVLPTSISRSDAVFNLSRTALLVEALIHGNYEFLMEGMQDRLHQNQRAALVPGLGETLQVALDFGAYGSALSGSGPTILALVSSDRAEKVSQAMLDNLASHGLTAKAYLLSVDSEGATVI